MNKHLILDFHFFLPCEDFRLVKFFMLANPVLKFKEILQYFFSKILININLEDIG